MSTTHLSTLCLKNKNKKLNKATTTTTTTTKELQPSCKVTFKMLQCGGVFHPSSVKKNGQKITMNYKIKTTS